MTAHRIVNDKTASKPPLFIGPALLTVFVAALFSCSSVVQPATGEHDTTPNKPQTAVEGRLKVSPSEDGSLPVVSLTGQWQFCPGRFLSEEPPGSNVSYSRHCGLLEVPSRWHSFSLPGQNEFGNLGYGTYRLLVDLPYNSGQSVTDDLALKLPDIKTSSRILINRHPVVETGRVASSQNHYHAGLKPVVAVVDRKLIQSEQTEILVEVANYDYYWGGLTENIYLGPYEKIIRMRQSSLLLDFFIIGAVLLMGIYHAGLYALRPQERTYLYFVIICLTIAIRPLLTGECYIFDLWPGFSWLTAVRLEYLTISVPPMFFLLFLNGIFPNEVPRRPKLILVSLSTVVSAVIVFTPPFYFTAMLVPMQSLLILYIVLATYIMAVSLKHRRSGSLVFLGGSSVFSAVVIHDILHNLNIIESTFLIPLGFLFFVFAQSILLSVRFSNAFTRVEVLTDDLEKTVREKDQLQVASNTDALTGLHNRRFVMSRLSEELENSTETGRHLCVAMIDIDHFKQVNDNWGHDIGDEVIVKTAAIMKNILRQNDIVARFGGEEFILVFPGSALATTAAVVERVRAEIEQTAFSHRQTVTVSAGLAAFITGQTADQLIKEADTMLYRAKGNGRNRVEWYT